MMKGLEPSGQNKKGKKKKKKGKVALDPAAKEELGLKNVDVALKKKTDAPAGSRSEDELSRLMAVGAPANESMCGAYSS